MIKHKNMDSRPRPDEVLDKFMISLTISGATNGWNSFEKGQCVIENICLNKISLVVDKIRFIYYKKNIYKINSNFEF